MLASGRARRLGPVARRIALITHIASAGAWLGIDVAMAAVIFTVLTTDDLDVRVFGLRALEVFTIWPLLVSGVICLLSGIVLGLGSKWGVLRYWWVLTKLALNLVLTALVVVALAPEVTRLAEQARRISAGELVPLDLGNLIYPPIVSPLALLLAMTLSVVKPWGRTPAGRRTSRLT